MTAELEIRKEKFYSLLKKGRKLWIVLAIIAIAIFGFYIRTQNLPNLKDSTNGQYIPIELDSFLILRYSEYYNQHGQLMENDAMRYYPMGFNPRKEFTFISWFISTLYNVMHAFDKSVSIQFADVIYPPVAFFIAIIFFFLLIRNLFNYKVALLASYTLAVAPVFLHRTIAGFSDKEALATAFIFMAFYFYTASWNTSKIWKLFLYSILSGFATTAAILSWGGSTLITFVIGAFILVEVFLNKFSKQDFYRDLSWTLTTIITLVLIARRYSITELVSSLTTTLLIFALLIIVVYYFIQFKNIFKLKEKFESRIPIGILVTIISVFLGLIFASIFVSPTFIFDKASNLIRLAVNPFGTTRWGLTVAESQQPYFVDWVANIGKFFTYLFMIGSVLLFYETIKKLKGKYFLTILYTIFILTFTMSRYSQGALLNGNNTISKVLYLGSLVVFIVILLYLFLKAFYKEKEQYNKVLEIDRTYLFLLVWFIFMVVAARGAVRVLYIFAPIVFLLSSYLVVKAFDYILSFKQYYVKILGSLLILFILLAPMIQGNLNEYTRSTLAQAKFAGPLYHQQWQNAGKWIRENTPENAIFAHWWDYGYWVQGGGNRTTITDGGNAVGALNHWMGRHVLTGQNESEALEFLKAHNATNLLIVSDEIGKYPAFSAIGADENYDRFSWLTTFSLDLSKTQETRDSTVLVYTGSYPFDDDFIYQEKLYPRRGSGIGAIFIPIKKTNNNSQIDFNNLEFEQPTAVVINNNQQISIPLECVFFGEKEVTFEVEGIPGCLRLIPVITRDGKMNPIGAGIYLSPDVRKTLFTKLYLYGSKAEYFKLVYTDDDKMPLAVFEGNLIGPIKIWEIIYPKYLNVPDYFYGDQLPNPEVTRVDPSYY